MVFAKTSKAASRLSDSIRRKSVDKKYLAVVRGKLNKKQGTLEDYLVKNNRQNKAYVASQNHKKAKKAVLEYEIIGEKEGLSLLSIQLHTGRPHQIRVQFSSRGYPIYGDQKYGSKVNKIGQQIALWSQQLTIEHPTIKKMTKVESMPPNTYPWNLWMHLDG